MQTVSGKLYTGISTDVNRRFQQHRQMSASTPSQMTPVLAGKRGAKGAKFFRTDPAQSVVYREVCAGRSEALKREAQIKKLSRQQKCVLAGIN